MCLTDCLADVARTLVTNTNCGADPLVRGRRPRRPVGLATELGQWTKRARGSRPYILGTPRFHTNPCPARRAEYTREKHQLWGPLVRGRRPRRPVGSAPEFGSMGDCGSRGVGPRFHTNPCPPGGQSTLVTNTNCGADPLVRGRRPRRPVGLAPELGQWAKRVQGSRPYLLGSPRFHTNPCRRSWPITPLKDHVGQVANLQRVANPPSGGWRTPAHQVFHPNPCPPGGQNTFVSAASRLWTPEDAGAIQVRPGKWMSYVARTPLKTPLVGRTPWSAADALVGLLASRRNSIQWATAGPGGPARTRGSAPLCLCSRSFSYQSMAAHRPGTLVSAAPRLVSALLPCSAPPSQARHWYCSEKRRDESRRGSIENPPPKCGEANARRVGFHTFRWARGRAHGDRHECVLPAGRAWMRMKDLVGGSAPATRRRVGNPLQVGNLPHMVFQGCPRHVVAHAPSSSSGVQRHGNYAGVVAGL